MEADAAARARRPSVLPPREALELLAATYVSAGVRRIATTDRRVFEAFEGVEVVRL